MRERVVGASREESLLLLGFPHPALRATFPQRGKAWRGVIRNALTNTRAARRSAERGEPGHPVAASAVPAPIEHQANQYKETKEFLEPWF